MADFTLRALTDRAFTRLSVNELSLCLFFNRAGHMPRVERFFAGVSRLGDGPFWYVLIAVLPVIYGTHATHVSLRMALAGFVGVLVYKSIKTKLVRPRPFAVHPVIRVGTPPLDQYSFPSGHTLHAVQFTIIGLYYYPELAVLLVPFAVFVALSRVVLGLHYPSDVLAGAALGTLLATLTLSF